MKKIAINLVLVIGSIFPVATFVNAEICIGNRCTDASSVGPVSVRSSMTNHSNSWNCSGPGCTLFQQRQLRPLQVQKVRPIKRIKLVGKKLPEPGEVVQMKLMPPK